MLNPPKGLNLDNFEIENALIAADPSGQTQKGQNESRSPWSNIKKTYS